MKLISFTSTAGILSTALIGLIVWLTLTTPSLSRPNAVDPSQRPVVIGYYADWTANKLSPEAIPYAKLTHINYAFAVVGADYLPKFDTPELLARVVKAAKPTGTKVLISIGGWTGSRYLSPMAASNVSRSTFVKATVDLVNTYGLDGVDLDWEYPNRVGELRAALGTSKEITMATRVEPFDGPDGRPVSDLRAFFPVLDRVNIMAYDINGAWAGKTGPNAPLQGPLSVSSSISAWTGAGWPPHRIALGVPFYGRATKVTASDVGANPSQGVSIETRAPQGDSDDALWAEPCPSAPQLYSGIWKWKNLRSQGVLPSVNQAGNGWVRGMDTASSTPWLFHSQTKIFISYDDPTSLNQKVNMAKCKGLAGVMFWDLHQDNGELLDAVVSGVGQTSC